MRSAEQMPHLLQRFQWGLILVGMAVVPKRCRIQTHDRYLLERVIFRDLFLSGRYRKILFVGCAPYTAWYPLIFERFASIRFDTMEADPSHRKYGSRRHHRVGRFETFGASDPEAGSYDLVILNGLFGFGTDDPAAIRRTLSAVPAVLKSGGLLLIGFNDDPRSSGFDPSWIGPGFSPSPIPGLSVHDFLCEGEHHHRFVAFRWSG